MTSSKKQLALLRMAIGLGLSVFLTGFIQAQSYKGFQVGRYEGQVTNKPGGNTGKTTLDIRSLDVNGNVQVYLRDSDGLEGEGDLSGTINANGVMQLSGTMTSPSDNSRWTATFIAILKDGQLYMGNQMQYGTNTQRETGYLAYTSTTQVRPAAPPTNTGYVTPVEGRGPVGDVYFGTRYTGTYLAKTVFYFAPNGMLYEGIEGGLSPAELARHRGPKMPYQVSGNRITIRQPDGSTSSVNYNPAKGGLENLQGFIVTRCRPFTRPQELVGRYEGGESVSGATASSGLQLNPDGTYAGMTVASFSTQTEQSQMNIGSQGSNGGTWRWSGWTLQLSDQAGQVVNQFVFPYNDGTQGNKQPTHIYVGGVMYQRN